MKNAEVLTCSALGMKIYGVGEHPVISFAASELRKYLERITNKQITIEFQADCEQRETGIWVGLESCFDDVSLPNIGEPEFDDAIWIKVCGNKGVIAGSNPRSILLAVYRYLTELGCRWVRPGKDGELIPQFDICNRTVDVVEVASYRHRGICIEGNISFDHVYDMIEWMPKLGFNSYFIQFQTAYPFFENWYKHRNNPMRAPEEFSVERAREIRSKIVQQIKKRDLIYHEVGHGWTCEVLGIPEAKWFDTDHSLFPDVTHYVASIGGKRELWKDKGLLTNLCYSTPDVRKLLVDKVVNYAETHPEVDVLHFWLADALNTQCECDRCRSARPADFYINILNEIDDAFTLRGVHMRIVFLIYFDLLWPPEVEKLKNRDRFILMFAPITRSYREGLRKPSHAVKIPPYVRNELALPTDVGENVKFLSEWQKSFDGDSFDFDYHLMWYHYNDPGYMQVSQVLSEDILGLGDIKLNGFISCQTQRSFFPTGLPLYMMGRKLWDKEQNPDKLTEDYFCAAFGDDAQLVTEYLKELSDIFTHAWFEKKAKGVVHGHDYGVSKAVGVIHSFGEVMERNMQLRNSCHGQSWEYLKHHAELCLELAKAFHAQAMGDGKVAQQYWNLVRSMAEQKEEELHNVLDVSLFIDTLKGNFES